MLKLIYAMADLDVEQLLNVYRKDNLDEAEFLSYLREDFFQNPGVFYAVWEENGSYKSAVRFEPYRDGLLLHALETASADRRKGYANLLLTNSLAFLRTTEHRVIYSHIAKRNKPSLALHKKCGFEICLDCATLLDGTVTQFCQTLQIHL